MKKVHLQMQNQPKQGLVEIAHGGTLFLDEIGELSLSLTTKAFKIFRKW
jgi:transcriptional regulator with PAS, ATPase and Fis domain